MKYVFKSVRRAGLIYTLMNLKFCIAHYKNEERLEQQAADSKRQEAIARYVDALYNAGDLR